MATEVRNASVDPQRRTRLRELGWQDITEPGAYVEVGSGDLYRVPKEALIQGSSPVIRKESAGASRLLPFCPDPQITPSRAPGFRLSHTSNPTTPMSPAPASCCCTTPPFPPSARWFV